MRGRIIKRKGSNNYTIVLQLGLDPSTGKRKQQWITAGPSKREAEKQMAKLIHELDSGTFVKPDKTIMRDYLKKWLSDYAKPNLSPRSYDRYTGIIHKYLIPELGSIQLTQLRPEHLQRHYTTGLNKGLSARTVRYHHALIHVALQTAVKWGLVNRNVADAVDPPRFKRSTMQTWNEDEVNRFLEAAIDSRYYPLFYTALFTGMRRGELLALRWQDIDFIYSQIYVSRSLHQLRNGNYIFTQPKSEKSRRTIAISSSLFLVLSEYRKIKEAEALLLGQTINEADLVFSNSGKPLRPNTVTYAWERMAAQADVKVIRLHDARHTHASLMLKQGIHPKIVQERLGHTSIQMTLDTYSHVAPGIQQAAAESFDKLLNHDNQNEISSKLVANR
jgi:integrase